MTLVPLSFDVVCQGYARTIYTRLHDIANTRVSTSVSMPLLPRTMSLSWDMLAHQCQEYKYTYLIQNRPFSKPTSLTHNNAFRTRAGTGAFVKIGFLSAQDIE